MSIKSISVSFNQNGDTALLEQQGWQDKGYLVTESYGNDFDCGNILELPEADNDVLERHAAHMATCAEQAEWRKSHFGWE